MNKKVINSLRRKKATRAKLSRTTKPRLSVHTSNRHIIAQIIDNQAGRTLLYASDLGKDFKPKGTKTEIAQEVGKIVAREAKKKNIKDVVFDRGDKKYHGRVKSLAEEARKELNF